MLLCIHQLYMRPYVQYHILLTMMTDGILKTEWGNEFAAAALKELWYIRANRQDLEFLNSLHHECITSPVQLRNSYGLYHSLQSSA